MAYRVMVQGVPIECATQGEAIALAKAVAQEGAAVERRAKRSAPRSRESPDTPLPFPAAAVAPTSAVPDSRREGDQGGSDPSWAIPLHLLRFFQALSEDGRKAISLIAKANAEVPLEQIRATLGLPDKRAASVLLASCSRTAKENGVDWDRLLEYRLTGRGDERQSLYKPGPLLRKEAV